MSLPATTPTNGPAEVLDISPESLLIANAYLQDQDMESVASTLGVPVMLVSKTLARKDVRAYIDQVFFNFGFNNRFKVRAAIDAVLKKKFADLEEADTGSSADILEILALSHKMTMEQMAKQIEMEKLHVSSIKNQVNVQINDQGISDGSKYGNLIQQLINLDNPNNTVDAE